jgi:hypothetical protein
MAKPRLYFTNQESQEILNLETENLLVTGISTIGLGTTSSPLNSQMSFELLDDETLTIKVTGTDGIIRIGTIELTEMV